MQGAFIRNKMSALSGFINYSSGDSEISDEEDEYTSKLVKTPPSGLGMYRRTYSVVYWDKCDAWSLVILHDSGNYCW